MAEIQDSAPLYIQLDLRCHERLKNVSECLADLRITPASPLRVGDGAGDIGRLAMSSELAKRAVGASVPAICSVYLTYI